MFYSFYVLYIVVREKRGKKKFLHKSERELWVSLKIRFFLFTNTHSSLLYGWEKYISQSRALLPFVVSQIFIFDGIKSFKFWFEFVELFLLIYIIGKLLYFLFYFRCIGMWLARWNIFVLEMIFYDWLKNIMQFSKTKKKRKFIFRKRKREKFLSSFFLQLNLNLN